MVFSQKDASDIAEKARIYALNGKAKKAYKFYYKAALLQKNNPDYYVEAARNYSSFSELSIEKNKKHFNSMLNEAFHIKPWYNKAILVRVDKYTSFGKYKLALEDLDSLLKRENKNEDAYRKKIEIYMKKSEYEKADVIYNQSIKLFDATNGLLGIIGEYRYRCYQENLFEECKNAALLFRKNKEDTSNDCYLAYSYYNLNNPDSACYYFKNCDIQKMSTLKMKDELKKVCEKKK